MPGPEGAGDQREQVSKEQDPAGGKRRDTDDVDQHRGEADDGEYPQDEDRVGEE